VLIVSNEQGHDAAVGKNIRTLKTSPAAPKRDVIVDEAKVQELLGVPAEKVVDYMALLGDSVDNIPGAKGLARRAAAELIQSTGKWKRAGSCR